MTNKDIKLSVILYYLGLSIISMSLKDDLTSFLQQEAVIPLL